MAELLKRLRRVPSRVLHRLRRQRALTALRGRHRPASVLVICHGNLCRSPFAAALLRRAFVGNGVRVASAGFTGPGRPSPPAAITAAARYRADLSAHRSQLLTPDGARAADLIVVMDPAQRREICDRFERAERDVVVLGDLDPQPIVGRTIRDPVEQPLAVFEETYARIERCVRGLQRRSVSLMSQRPAAVQRIKDGIGLDVVAIERISCSCSSRVWKGSGRPFPPVRVRGSCSARIPVRGQLRVLRDGSSRAMGSPADGCRRAPLRAA